jgi:hypothetical protein
MRHYIAALTALLLFTACSNDDEQTKTRDVITVEKEVQKDAHKEEALVCMDEDNTITCKLLTKRKNKEREVRFNWKSPNAKDDRKRKMVLPANHASIYDARNKKGRVKGLWKVHVTLEDNAAISTTFVIR